MTKKELVKIAEAIASIEDEKQRRKVAVKIGKVCFSTNPRFDVLKFYTACGCKSSLQGRDSIPSFDITVDPKVEEMFDNIYCTCTGEGHKESCSMFYKEEDNKVDKYIYRR